MKILSRVGNYLAFFTLVPFNKYMLQFNFHPNYQRIHKHFQWPVTPEQMQVENPTDYPIVIDWWDEERDKTVFNSFQKILSKYDLVEFGDDLLLLLLLKYKFIEERIYDLELDYNNRKRAKDLAKFLLLAKQTPANKYNKIVIATNTDTAKVTDPDIMAWIGQLITENIEKGNYPISLLGLAAIDMFTDRDNPNELNIEKLAAAASERIITPGKLFKEQQADFCLFIYKYLVMETGIKPDADKWFSDKLSNFYFDILELFGYVDRLKIESEPKDWTRTFLMNRLKQLNSSFTGK
jgi:hypothetical protein